MCHVVGLKEIWSKSKIKNTIFLGWGESYLLKHYSGPSLSGHSQHGPPFLEWPKDLLLLLQVHLLLSLTKGHLFNVATISKQTGWP